CDRPGRITAFADGLRPSIANPRLAARSTVARLARSSAALPTTILERWTGPEGPRASRVVKPAGRRSNAVFVPQAQQQDDAPGAGADRPLHRRLPDRPHDLRANALRDGGGLRSRATG